MPVQRLGWWSLFSVLLVCSGARVQGVQAQVPEVSFRLAHEGALLPPGTVLAVLAEQSAAGAGSALQPRFLAPDAYPMAPDAVLRQDTLTGLSRTAATYPTTAASGTRYFLYARTPDGTLYASYSAEHDSLKFDTVSRGVMAVAPVRDAAMAERIRAAFFSGPLAPSTPAATDTTTAAPPVTAPVAPPVTGTEPSAPRAAGLVVSYGALIAVLGILLALFAVLVVLLVRYRRRLADEELPAPQLNLSGWHPDRHAELQQTLTELEGKYQRLQKTYNVLLARHKALVREWQQRQESPPSVPVEQTPPE